MPSRKKTWTRAFGVLSLLLLTSCAHAPLAIDSYCQVYNPVVVSRGDGQITAPLAVKRRILANELTYRQECKK
jgi:hypothetical protein